MIGQQSLNQKSLSFEEKKKLYIYLSELKARGLPIPEGIELPKNKNETGWNLDSDGWFVKRDGRHFKPRPELIDFINDDARFVLLKSGRGGGKALWTKTPILTLERGWQTMESLVVGDYVFNELGNPVKVLFKSNIMYGHKCYSVKFNEGSEIIADAEHLWFTQSKKERNGNVKSIGKVRTTEELIKNITIGHKKEKNYSIPTTLPLRYSYRQNFIIDPYVLGAWLGDGTSAGGRIACADEEILEQFRKCGHVVRKQNSPRDPYMYGVSDLHTHLSKLKLLNNKHIPQEYMIGSFEQRLSLLQGLMDTDGTCDTRGHSSFTATKRVLAEQVYELCIGLGIKPGFSVGRAKLYGKDCGEVYDIYINTDLPIFRLTRKLKRLENGKKQASRHKTRFIESVTEVSSVPVQCIEVESPSHLYLAGKTLIPTHNTTSAAQKALFKIKQGLSGAVMSPDFENFRTSTWPEFRDWIPWQMVVPKHRFRASPSWEPIKPFSIVFINGAHVYCKGLKDPESARGSNVNWFWYDEGRRDPTGLGWKNAIAFCRVGEKPQAWCTTTMAGTDHWTNTFFEGKSSDELQKLIEELMKKGINQKLYSVHKTSTRSNEENLDPMFYASLMSAYPSGYLRARELDGEAADEGGSLGDRRWFDGKALPSEPEWVVKKVRFWDLAGTEKKILGKKMNDPDESVGSLLGTDVEKNSALKKFCILDQVGGHWEWSKLKEMVVAVANADGPSVEVCFEQEPASGGKNQVAELKELLKRECPWIQFSRGKKSTDIAGAWNPKDAGDRVMGANTWFAEAQTTDLGNGVVKEGQWYYVPGLWTEKFFTQLDTFNGIKHDDRITSITGARHVIAPIQKRWSSPKFLAVGKSAPEEKKEVALALH